MGGGVVWDREFFNGIRLISVQCSVSMAIGVSVQFYRRIGLRSRSLGSVFLS